MASRLVLRIQERYQRLTAGEQKLARLIMDGQDDTLTYSATELAEQAGVSKATAARFFQHLGYADFNEVKLQAREERNRTEPYGLSVGVSEQIALGKAVASHLELELSAGGGRERSAPWSGERNHGVSIRPISRPPVALAGLGTSPCRRGCGRRVHDE